MHRHLIRNVVQLLTLWIAEDCYGRFFKKKADPRFESFNESWIKYFFQLTITVASKSKDPSTKVGAICVDIPSKRILTTSYNGFPAGVAESTERWERPVKQLRVVHAEANCISSGARFGIILEGSAIFITHPACVECTKLILSAGIKEVYFLDIPLEIKGQREWHKTLPIAKEMCEECGVKVYAFSQDELNLSV